MIKLEQLNGKDRVAVSSICDVAGIKPYAVKQRLQKLTNNRLIEAPYQNQGNCT